MRGSAFFLLLTAYLAVNCSGPDDAEPTALATLTPSLTPNIEVTASPEPTVSVGATPAPDPVGPIVAILPDNVPDSLLLYDIGLGEILLDMQLPPAGDWYYRGDARAGRIFVAAGRTVSEFGLDGAVREVYRTPDNSYHVGDVAISPDGATLAVTMERWPAPNGTLTPADGSYVLFLDSVSGDVISRFAKPFIPNDQREFGDFVGQFYWLVWRDDGSGVVVSGATNSERPGGWATLYLDGRVVQHDLVDYGSVSPDGRMASHGDVTIQCMAVASEQLQIRDLNTDTDVSSVEAANGYVLTAWDWSPDSSELLVAIAPLVESTDPAVGRGPCPDFESRGWLVVDAATGKRRPVEDLHTLYQRWYVDQPLITMTCTGNTTYLGYSRWAERHISCYDAPGDHPLLLDGRRIAEGRQFQVIGIVDP